MVDYVWDEWARCDCDDHIGGDRSGIDGQSLGKVRDCLDGHSTHCEAENIEYRNSYRVDRMDWGTDESWEVGRSP